MFSIFSSPGAWEEAITETLKISVVNLIILLTCILTLIYLFISHLIVRHNHKKLLNGMNKITEDIKVGIVVLDFDDLKIKYANKGFYNLTGFKADEIERVYEGKFLLLGKGNQQQNMENQLRESSQISLRFELKQKSEKFIWVYLTGAVEISKGKRSINCVLMDVDNIIREEESNRFNEERYRIASDVSGDVLFEYDIKNDQMIFSERYYDMFGTSEVIDNYIEYLKRAPNVCKEDGLRIDELIDQIRYETAIQGEFRMKDVSGNYVWVQLKGRKVRGKDNKYKKIYGKLININNVKVEISKLKEVSEIDVLTGLLNKGAIRKLIEDKIKNSKKPTTLFVIDVDNFKKVNDTLGHQYGDLVLSTLARKLKAAFQNVTFGRIGGDEFIGYTLESDPIMIEKIAKSINNITYETYENEGLVCSVSTSLGISISNDRDYEAMFKKADDALYTTKKNGKNSYTIV